jgi:N-acyl-L-homoserine lactone synthetase
MITTVLTDEIAIAERRFAIEIVQSAKQLREVFRLRYQVYCVERGHRDLPGDEGEEFDEFDVHSEHVLLRQTSDGEAIGTARIIGINQANPGASFQMQQFCQPSLLGHLPLQTCGEISRFALSRRRQLDSAQLALVRLALVRGLVRLSSETGLTHWLALMERSLIRLNERNAIHFDPIGSAVSCHGVRQPTVAELTRMLGRVRCEQFPTWNFLTAGGSWFGEEKRTLAAA